METHRDEVVMVLQVHAISEPVIREHVREKFRLIHETVLARFTHAGLSHAEVAVNQFMGTGLLIMVSEVLDLPELLCFDERVG